MVFVPWFLFPFQMGPSPTSLRTLTSTWKTLRPRRRLSPSSHSSGSSRRRSEMRSHSELTDSSWRRGRLSGNGVTFACKQIHTCWKCGGCDGVDGNAKHLLIMWHVCELHPPISRVMYVSVQKKLQRSGFCPPLSSSVAAVCVGICFYTSLFPPVPVPDSSLVYNSCMCLEPSNLYRLVT